MWWKFIFKPSHHYNLTRKIFLSLLVCSCIPDVYDVDDVDDDDDDSVDYDDDWDDDSDFDDDYYFGAGERYVQCGVQGLAWKSHPGVG